MNLIRALVLALLMAQLAACAAPSYYAQAVSGHLKLMKAREDIDALLAAGDINPQLAGKLETALNIRNFAIDELDLPAGNSYQQYAETGKDAVTWNVIATPEFSLQTKQWCFLVSGCVSYRGYFDPQAAQKYAARLAAKGHDTAISPAIAYSTLGWFDDPLLDTMLNYDDPQLAALLVHELAHQKLYVKGDTAFNEAYAGFVEELGTRRWLQWSGRQADLADWRRSTRATSQFQELLQQTVDKLNRIYDSGMPETEMRVRKAAVLAQLESGYEALVRTEWNGHNYYAAWFSRDLNNARLALTQSYRGGVCAFNSLFETANGDITRFHALAAEKARLDAGKRHKWLEQPCPAIASKGDL